MADSDSEKGAGSDAGSDAEGDGGFDPAKDLSKLSDKERKKWEKSLQKWRMFLDFIFRHIAIATFRYNCFEHEELTPFMIALEKAEALREQGKLKKGEVAKITSYKTMKDAADLLVKHRFINEANRIKRFLDIAGRMRGISMIAGGYYKALKKGKVKGLDRVKYYLDYWKGFTVRSFDYTELEFLNADPQTFNSLEKKYLIWPTVVRTAINLSQKFLKKTSESTGLELLSTDPKVLQQHMQAAEFVVAAKIEDMLFQKVVQETKSFILGGVNPLITPPTQQPAEPADGKKWEMPIVEDIDSEMLKPIPDGGMLLHLPNEPPKEKKKKKKGKKGKGGRSLSASSHKGKGKKKKKKK